MTIPPCQVLLVEDDEDDYLILRLMFAQAEGLPCEIRWASTFAEGLEALAERAWDVILVDYDLGANTGLDFIRAAEERRVSSPIIVITGRPRSEVALKARQAGASGFVPKEGLNPSILEKTIRQATGSSPGKEETG